MKMKNLVSILFLSFFAMTGFAQTLTLGRGLTGGSYNGGSNVTTTLDTSKFYTWLKQQALQQNALGTTTTDGLLFQNTTAAANNAQQITPSLHFQSNGWGTTAGSSQSVDFRMYTLPVQSGTPSGNLFIQSSINGGAWGTNLQLGTNGSLTVAVNGSSIGSVSAGMYQGTINSISTTSQDGLIMRNNSAGTSGTPVQYSPRIRLTGNAYTGSASQAADWIQEVKPINGTNPITSKLVFSSQVNAAGYNERFALADNGLFYLGGTALTGNQLVGANTGASGMEAKTLNGSSGTGLTVTNGTGTITFSNDTTKLQTIANFFPLGDTRYANLAGVQTITNKTISGSNNTITNIGNSSLTNSTISGVALGGNLNALSQGSGISAFSYNGSSTGSVAVDQSFSPTWTGKHTFNNSVTASSGTAQGLALTPSLTAAANNDVLAALDMTPTFTTGSFTGVQKTLLRGNYTGLGQATTDAIILRNTSAATSSVQQYAPAVTWMSNAWNTTSSISEPIAFRMYMSTDAGAYLSNGNLQIDVSQNGGSYVSRYIFDPYGNIVVSGGYSTYNGLSTPNDGVYMGTGATATAGTPAILSGRIRMNGNAWNTSASAAQPTDFTIENKPVSGSTITSRLVISSQINNGGYNERFALLSNGLFYLNGTALTANQIVGANSGANGMEGKTLSGSAGTGLTVTNGTGTITFSNDTTTVQTIANFFPKADTRYLKTSTAASTYQPLLGYTAANDANVVHLTGDENIAGTKTFANAIAIGTTTVPTGYQFAINGNTIATSVTVKAHTNWPDYVFDRSYALRPLKELSDFIRRNHHLPEMPSASEIQAKGQDLGAINEKLVKKVEELTLYLIEKDKQLKDQQTQIDSQEDRLKKIEKQIQQNGSANPAGH